MILIEVMGDVYKISRKNLKLALEQIADDKVISWDDFGTNQGSIRLHATDIYRIEAKNFMVNGLPEWWK